MLYVALLVIRSIMLLGPVPSCVLHEVGCPLDPSEHGDLAQRIALTSSEVGSPIDWREGIAMIWSGLRGVSMEMSL